MQVWCGFIKRTVITAKEKDYVIQIPVSSVTEFVSRSLIINKL